MTKQELIRFGKMVLPTISFLSFKRQAVPKVFNNFYLRNRKIFFRKYIFNIRKLLDEVLLGERPMYILYMGDISEENRITIEIADKENSHEKIWKISIKKTIFKYGHSSCLITHFFVDLDDSDKLFLFLMACNYSYQFNFIKNKSKILINKVGKYLSGEFVEIGNFINK